MKHRQIIVGEYVFTPCKNAFNNKVSYWVSKDGCSIAVYAFTPWDSQNLKEMTTPETLQSYIKVFDETLQRLSGTPEQLIGTPLNDNEKKLVEKLENAKRYVKGELELNCDDGVWTALDYSAYLGGAFSIEAEGFDGKIITVSEAESLGVDVIKCCNECGIAYVGQ